VAKESTVAADRRRPKVSQADFPIFTLEQSLRLPQAIWDEFAGKGAAPHDVAIALDMSPTSGTWRNLAGSAIAYGLVEGGYNATRMTLTSLGRRIVAPTAEGDDDRARVEAVLQPRVMGEFLRRYDRAKFPSDQIAENVLVELGLPKDRAPAARDVLLKNARSVGIIRETKTGPFVAIDEPGPAQRSLEDSRIPVPPADAAPAVAEPPVTPPRVAAEGATPVPILSRGDSGPGTVATTQRPLTRGTIVDCYKLKQRLGAGFSAEVWSATVQRAPPGTELEKNQAVAIKFYHAHAMALPDQVLRVEREYRIAQSIRHSHLIRIYEFLLASPRPHHNFLVMDLARGILLKKAIEANQVTPSQALRILHQIISALDELHGAGALHRDVKPGNITVEIVGDAVHATVLDLGIVTITYEKGVTAVSHFLGSKHWAPIEQLMGEGLDERSDLYSASAVAYNALTGQEPYAGSLTEAAVAVNMGRSQLLLPAFKDVPDDVREMINACLSYKRDDRPSSARDCLDVLERHL
jgi:hypothetical protein